MATVTGLTAERMLAIEAASVVDGDIVGTDLILTKHDGSTINAGVVVGPVGPQGPQGVAGFGAIPGEVRMWPGSAVPPLATFGKWVWADGAVYPVATYPLSASYIAAGWRTFGGASDPGAANFRVPDLRGLTPVGMDAMPGGARANRMTRSVAIILAGMGGQETHIVTIAEMPSHGHGVNDNGHKHQGKGNRDGSTTSGNPWGYFVLTDHGPDGYVGENDSMELAATGISIQAAGGGAAHENVQPSVFVPYIVCLHG